MKTTFLNDLEGKIDLLKEQGLYKKERIINSSQASDIKLDTGQEVVNLCANNYLGLASSKQIKKIAAEALAKYGYGMASVRFICGTQTIHKELESTISSFLGTQDTILYSSCFDANTGLFETILDKEDAIISDELNHASIIDGVRLCKASRYRYKNSNMEDLEKQLIDSQNARYRLIVTDGVFSMDGLIANLPDICKLAKKYDALVMVDDSHSIGVLGKNGRGTPSHWGVEDKIDIYTGTLGKALGGASGGYTSGKAELIEYLRQRSRPYLFSNSIVPMVAASSIEAIKILEASSSMLDTLRANSQYFRAQMSKIGFTLLGADHAIVPVLLKDAKVASNMADKLLKLGIYVIAFSFPVVPKGLARIRVQLSAAHTKEQLEHAVSAFKTVGIELGIIS
ncbi:MAG: glycine C-acetyltransferase [Campylobacteraceae bacterium]|nr:glycine C-acetyltransferase [Campylobacteraceae bacterium]